MFPLAVLGVETRRAANYVCYRWLNQPGRAHTRRSDVDCVAVVVTQRVLLANDLPWLGVAERGVLGVLDAGWSVARGVLWSVGIPWSMMITGVKGPGAFRRGRRGPLRRALGRAFSRNDLRQDVRDRARLEAAPEGAVAGLRGRVRAIESLPLAPPGTVWSRVDALVETTTMFTERWNLVYERGMDFDLVLDDEGSTVVRILGVDGFLVAKPAPQVREPHTTTFAVSAALPAAMPAGVEPRLISSGRRYVTEGDEVRVVGVKTHVIDASVESRLARDTPLRMALAAGPKRPLLIAIS